MAHPWTPFGDLTASLRDCELEFYRLSNSLRKTKEALRWYRFHAVYGPAIGMAVMLLVILGAAWAGVTR